MFLLFGGALSAAETKMAPANLDALEGHKAAELDLWGRMGGMFARRVLLVDEEPVSYGVYTPRKDNRFLAGEPVRIYVEPVGHTIRKKEDLFLVSLSLDFTLVDESGKVLGGERGYDRLELKSRRPLMEFMTHFTYDTAGLPPGSYVFETLLRDSFSSRSLKVEVPVIIVDKAAP
jgi:hypothetical protein